MDEKQLNNDNKQDKKNKNQSEDRLLSKILQQYKIDYLNNFIGISINLRKKYVNTVTSEVKKVISNDKKVKENKESNEQDENIKKRNLQGPSIIIHPVAKNIVNVFLIWFINEFSIINEEFKNDNKENLFDSIILNIKNNQNLTLLNIILKYCDIQIKDVIKVNNTLIPSLQKANLSFETTIINIGINLFMKFLDTIFGYLKISLAMSNVLSIKSTSLIISMGFIINDDDMDKIMLKINEELKKIPHIEKSIKKKNNNENVQNNNNAQNNNNLQSGIQSNMQNNNVQNNMQSNMQNKNNNQKTIESQQDLLNFLLKMNKPNSQKKVSFSNDTKINDGNQDDDTNEEYEEDDNDNDNHEYNEN